MRRLASPTMWVMNLFTVTMLPMDIGSFTQHRFCEIEHGLEWSYCA